MNRLFGVHPSGCQSCRNTLKRGHRTVPHGAWPQYAMPESWKLSIIPMFLCFPREHRRQAYFVCSSASKRLASDAEGSPRPLANAFCKAALLAVTALSW